MAFELLSGTIFGGTKRNEELMVKVFQGDHKEVVRLLKNKANPNFVIKAKQSWSSAQSITPLFTALLAPNANLEIVKALLDSGANPNTIVTNGKPYGEHNPYQSLLLIAVENVANAADDAVRQTNTEIYCALREKNADMHCEPSKYIHKGDASFANLDYMEWDLSIDYYLDRDRQNLRSVWADLEQTFESVMQKNSLNDALTGMVSEPVFRRIKI